MVGRLSEAGGNGWAGLGWMDGWMASCCGCGRGGYPCCWMGIVGLSVCLSLGVWVLVLALVLVLVRSRSGYRGGQTEVLDTDCVVAKRGVEELM